MTTNDVVLVLGSGASAHLGFPTGRGLLNQIIRIDQGPSSDTILSKLLELGFDRHECITFARELNRSQQPSVDAFLERRLDFVEVGKAAIAACLAKHEDPSRFNRDDQMSWYEFLYHRIDSRPDEFHNNHVGFVTFNYDRSLEYFLTGALSASYKLSETDAAKLVSSLLIIHVHGQLSNEPFGSASARPYQSAIDRESIANAASGIRIPGLRDDTDAEYAQAVELLRTTPKICFLGFGFHPDNIDRLRLDLLRPNTKLWATACGLRAEECHRIQQSLPEAARRLLPDVHQRSIIDFLKDYHIFD